MRLKSAEIRAERELANKPPPSSRSSSSTFMTEVPTNQKKRRRRRPSSCRPTSINKKKKISYVRNQKSKNGLHEIIHRHGKIPPHSSTMMFPTDELHASNMRVRKARRGKRFAVTFEAPIDWESVLDPIPYYRDPEKFERKLLKVERDEEEKREHQAANNLQREKNEALIHHYDTLFKKLTKEISEDTKNVTGQTKKSTKKKEKEQISSMGKNAFFEFDDDKLGLVFQEMDKEEERKKKMSSHADAHGLTTKKDGTMWRNRFISTQLTRQEKLLNELDQRALYRSMVYANPSHLGKVIHKSLTTAKSWWMSRIGGAGAGFKKYNDKPKKDNESLWIRAYNRMQHDERGRFEAIFFYSSLQDFCQENGMPTTFKVKQVLDNIRQQLITDKILTKDLLYDNMVYEMVAPDALHAQKLMHFMRKMLNVDMKDLLLLGFSRSQDTP
eukprot:CAMPEP_0117419852 /NCGR_PEP_ID=MMETSP0758-20121206/1322_1 /TAXON_ID=63605 /ORGANISM="Percolomonas cosmopolitus, Strain AE-1 (ATCC 50343)" /LENGTH=441 /DNA_ID=CAMNT_0005201147 /DNA_START=768 /DNA_END=2093 /DNA_ORIENTATION=-